MAINTCEHLGKHARDLVRLAEAVVSGLDFSTIVQTAQSA